MLWVVERGVKAWAVAHAYLGQCVEVEGKITVVVDLKHCYAKAPLVSMTAYVWTTVNALRGNPWDTFQALCMAQNNNTS